MANPHMIVTSRLTNDLHFLDECSHFPKKHWLEIPAEERAQVSERLQPDRQQWGSDAFHMEKRGMLIQSLEDYLSSPFRSTLG